MSNSERCPEPAGLAALRATEGWKKAIAQLRTDWDRDGQRARAAARDYATVYAGVRGLMVVDVVLSRQRRYKERVIRLAADWRAKVEAAGGNPTLAWLAEHPDACENGLSLRRGEKETILGCVDGLLRYAADHNVVGDEDRACAAWSADTAGLEFAPGLDPYIGSIKGIGQALFAYLRMRSGGDGIKADVRILRRMQDYGLHTSSAGTSAALLLAPLVADELGITLLELDQLLWA